MIKILLITYEKSKEGTVMCVEENNLLSSTFTVGRTFTGEKAEQLYKELTGQTERRDKK